MISNDRINKRARAFNEVANIFSKYGAVEKKTGLKFDNIRLLKSYGYSGQYGQNAFGQKDFDTKYGYRFGETKHFIYQVSIARIHQTVERINGFYELPIEEKLLYLDTLAGVFMQEQKWKMMFGEKEDNVKIVEEIATMKNVDKVKRSILITDNFK